MLSDILRNAVKFLPQWFTWYSVVHRGSILFLGQSRVIQDELEIKLVSMVLTVSRIAEV